MFASRAASRFVVVALALGACVIAGCGGDDDKLTMYSGRVPALIDPAIAIYEKSGKDVKVRTGDSPPGQDPKAYKPVSDTVSFTYSPAGMSFTAG